MPQNDGMFRPIKVVAPKGTIFNPNFPRSCFSRFPQVQRLVDNMNLALADALPEQATAGNSARVHFCAYAGFDEEAGEYWIYIEVNEGSYGAATARTGWTRSTTSWPNTRNNPIEELDMRFPMRCEQYELRPEPAAPGKWRGGIGIVRRNRFLVDGFFLRGRPPADDPPRACSAAGTASSASVPQEPGHGDARRASTAKVIGVPFRPARSSSSAEPSGAGFGDPLERDPLRCARTCSTTSRPSSSRATPTGWCSGTRSTSRSTRPPPSAGGRSCVRVRPRCRSAPTSRSTGGLRPARRSRARATDRSGSAEVDARALRELIDDPARRAGESAAAVTEAFLDRIEAEQPRINAFIAVTPELARAAAKRADRARASGAPLPLDGMPIALKDNIDVAGVPTTVGSALFTDAVASEDAEVVRRLRDAGAVILGKLALHEFVLGGTTNNPWFGPCRNPWDTTRIPGGSSGGSGAALAADLCVGALGSDTGGSIRVPAAVNGVCGLRPTLGSISTRGTFPIAWTLDTVGPMARAAADVRALLAVLAGHDPRDPRSRRVSPSPTRRESGGLDGLRVGVPDRWFFDDVDPEVARCVRDAVAELEGLGAGIVGLDVPDAERATETCTVMIRVEALALHGERLERHPELIGEDTRRRLELGREVSGIDMAGMTQWMYEWRVRIADLFDAVDVVATPTAPEPPPPIEGSETLTTTARISRYTQAWAVAGVPALSVPCGFTAGELPVGLQLAAAEGADDLLLDVAEAYQTATDWHRCRPS